MDPSVIRSTVFEITVALSAALVIGGLYLEARALRRLAAAEANSLPARTFVWTVVPLLILAALLAAAAGASVGL